MTNPSVSFLNSIGERFTTAADRIVALEEALNAAIRAFNEIPRHPLKTAYLGKEDFPDTYRLVSKLEEIAYETEV